MLIPFILLSLVLVTSATAQENLPRTALVMGVGDYGGAKFKGGTIPNLPGITSADLTGMEAKLKSLGFSVTTVANPTLSEAKEAVDIFSSRIKANPGVSLFYFSGHGGEYEGKNYLIPRGANVGSKADLSDEALSAQRVLNGMEESGAQVNLMFLDCCREDLGKSVGGAEMAPLKAKGSFIGFATRSGDFADPGEEGSPYTRFLLKHLDRPGLSVADMYSLVIGEVKDYSKRVLGEERRPGFYSELDAPFYLVPVKFTPGGAPATSVMSEAEIERRALEKAGELAAKMTAMPEVSMTSSFGTSDSLLGVSKEKPYQNSLGMAFVPAGTPGVLFSVWETRVKDFENFAEESGHGAISDNEFGSASYTLEAAGEWKQAGGSWRNPRFPSKQNGDHPVVCVNYLDAEAFCSWLTKKERLSKKIPAGASYRLPSDSEWSRACGGTEFPWGDKFPPKDTDGNYAGVEAMMGALAGISNELSRVGFRDGAARTSVVGIFNENSFGLHDMGGNVFEWCSTWYTADLNDEETKTAIPGTKDDGGGQYYRVLRGASWNFDDRVRLRSSYRRLAHPLDRVDIFGFRSVLVMAGSAPAEPAISEIEIEKRARHMVAKLTAGAAEWNVPKGFSVPNSSLSPDNRFGVSVPINALHDENAEPNNSLIELTTGRVLTVIKANTAWENANHQEVMPTRWSKDGSLLLWEVDGKWCHHAFVLMKIMDSQVKWQVDVLRAAQQEILARTKMAAPTLYAAAKIKNKGSGLAYPDGFTIDVDVVDNVSITTPLRLKVVLSSNPKQIEGMLSVYSHMDAVVDADGRFEVTKFSLGHFPLRNL
jgi:formylglycine-generating enzyme required for sulfatase activity